MTRVKLPKAPFGCFWRGRVLWARVQVTGQNYAWSLRTEDPEIATDRRNERIKELRKPVKVKIVYTAKVVKRRVMAGEALTEEEKAFVASAIDLAMGKRSRGPAWLADR